MNRRTLFLSVATGGVGFCILAALPFVFSLSPSERAKAEYMMSVSLSEIPETGYKEVMWHDQAVFFIRTDAIKAYVIPMHEGTYRLPDTHWDRAVVPCEKFVFTARVFQCLDASLSPWWRETARWDSNGNNLSKFFPPLPSAPFVIDGQSAILGRIK